MGITTSFVVSSELVSHAYAHLVDFHPDETDGGTEKAVARIAFMPDPVCAALAMGMMHEKWVLTNFQGVDHIAGEATTFWSKKAMELLSSGLCLPEKGNPGEIMVALYMLFCGDLLRYRQDQALRHFSVPLEEWFQTLKSPCPPSASSRVGGLPSPTPPNSQNPPLDADPLNAVSSTDDVGSSYTHQELHSQKPATDAVRSEEIVSENGCSAQDRSEAD